MAYWALCSCDCASTDRFIVGLVPALEGLTVLGQDAAEVIEADGDAGDEVLDQCPVAHAVDAGLEDHLVVQPLPVG